MSKKRPSDAELRSALNLGIEPPQQQEARLAPSDPVMAMPMKVDIAQIALYDHNPRRSRNSAHEDIKESVRAQGLKQPLVITRRPGAPTYMLKHGGNTRLAVLKELFAETGERRFQMADCLFEPWKGETDVLVSHIVENEVRGSLTFLDKARAVREAAVMLEADGGEKLSLRQLSDALRERGFRISAGMISKCFYALDTLAQAIPLALAAGIGRPQIEKLRQLHTGAKQVWDNHRLGSAALFEDAFRESLANADREDWSHEDAWRAVELVLSQRANVPLNRVAAELEAVLAASGSSDEDAPSAAAIPLQVRTPAQDAAPTRDAGREEPVTASRPVARPATGPIGDPAAPSGHPAKVLPVETPAAQQELESPEPAARLRERLYEAAHRAAAELGLAPCVSRYEHGAGFLVTEFPPEGFVHGDPQLVQATSWWWWFLVSISETLEMPAALARKLLPPGCAVGKAHLIADEQARYDAMFSKAGAPDVSRFGLCVLSEMSNSLLRSYRQLEDDYRALIGLKRQRGESLHAQEV